MATKEEKIVLYKKYIEEMNYDINCYTTKLNELTFKRNTLKDLIKYLSESD